MPIPIAGVGSGAPRADDTHQLWSAVYMGPHFTNHL